MQLYQDPFPAGWTRIVIDQITYLDNTKLILLRLRDSTHRPYAGLLHRPHLFQRIVLPVLSGYLGALLCIALTVA